MLMISHIKSLLRKRDCYVFHPDSMDIIVLVKRNKIQQLFRPRRYATRSELVKQHYKENSSYDELFL